MKKLIVLSIFSLFLFILFGLLNSPHQVKAQNDDHVSGQILVKFQKDTPQQEIDRQINKASAKVVDKIDFIDVLVLKVPQNTEDQVLNALSKNPHVEYAEFDYTATAFSNPDDTYFNNQWGLENVGQTINGVVGNVDADINAPTAWITTPGSVRVAILDTGINESHLDLAGKVVEHQDFTGSSSSYNDIYGHGTHVAGIVAANTNNGKGVAGVCSECTLLNGKVLNDSGSGAYSWIVKGIGWAVQNNAKVINMSFGGSVKSSTLENAVNTAWNSGVVVVAAAGNSNNPSKTYPGAYTNVIAVAATDNKDNKASFSSYGAKWVDVAAPGVYIYSTWKNSSSASKPSPDCDDSGCYKFASGTSMATPMVAGVAGLVWSTSLCTGSDSACVRNRIESTADQITGTGTYWSKGRVNAARAVTP